MEQDEIQHNIDFNEENDLKKTHKKISNGRIALLVFAAFLLGISGGYFARGQLQQADKTARAGQSSQYNNVTFDIDSLVAQVNPVDGYDLGVSYGELGPKVLAAGGIDYSAFAALYESSDHPLTDEQIEILTKGTDKPIVINAENAHFLLNFFWAVGLVNKNPILTEGPITQYSEGQVERFASTGGWTLGMKPVRELFASKELISLTPEQQALVEETAALIYRPCCNNPTLFPDCNHGMAMLGLLELMASQGAASDEMLQAAKYMNAFWFPQQAVEMAMFLKSANSTSFQDADPALIVGKEMSSGSGFAVVHQYLQSNGLLAQTLGGNSSCSN